MKRLQDILCSAGQVSCILALLALSACSAEQDGSDSASVADSLSANTFSNATVELFEEGIVNSSWPEFAITWTATGDTIYFNRTNVNRTSLAIMMTVRVEGEWQTPEVAPFSGEFYDIMPAVSPDGSIFFSSRRMNEDSGQESFDNFVYLGSGAPVRLPGSLNTDSTEVSVSTTNDGSIYFDSNRTGRNRVWVSEMVDGSRSPAKPVPIPGVQESGNPYLSSDGSTLLFVSTVAQDADIFYTCLVDGSWTFATRFSEPINSSEDDYAPSADPDGFIHFTSLRPGVVDNSADLEKTPPSDIYRSSVQIQSLCNMH